MDLPSRDGTNWLSTRFRPSVETRRRIAWLRVASTRMAFSELRFGALREEVAGTREAGGTVGVESLVECRSTRERTVARSIG